MLEKISIFEFSLAINFQNTTKKRVRAKWPSGLRRHFKAVVFGRGFEPHFSQIKLLLLFYTILSICIISESIV